MGPCSPSETTIQGYKFKDDDKALKIYKALKNATWKHKHSSLQNKKQSDKFQFMISEKTFRVVFFFWQNPIPKGYI